MRERARRIVRETVSRTLHLPAKDEAAIEHLVDLEMRDFGPPSLPRSDESAAVAPLHPKTAALLYDRVWGSPRSAVPSSVAFWGGTAAEVRARTIFSMYAALELVTDQARAEPFLEECTAEFAKVIGFRPSGTFCVADGFARTVASAIQRTHNVHVIPTLTSTASGSAVYQPGRTDVIVAALVDVPVVDEEALTWEQVSEVRSDKDARRNLRRFVHWLDGEMTGKASTYIAHEICERYERYSAASRKHGLRLALGTLSSLLDSRVLSGGAATVAALSFAKDFTYALWGGAAVLAATAAVNLAHIALDANHSNTPDIAFILEVAQRDGVGSNA